MVVPLHVADDEQRRDAPPTHVVPATHMDWT